MYERKDTHRDDIIRRFGSRQRRKYRRGTNRQPVDEPKEEEVVEEAGGIEVNLPGKVVVLLGVLAAIVVSLMIFF